MIDFKKCCRLCGEDISFGVEIFSKCDGINISEIIFKYLSINITVNDVLPIQICDTCRVKLITFDEYVLKCIEKQIELTEISQQNVSSLENVIKDEWSNNKEIKEEIDDLENVQNGDSDIYSEGESEPTAKPKKITDTKIKNKNRQKSDDDYLPVNISTSSNKKRTIQKKTANRRGKPCTTDYSILKYECHLCNEKFPTWGPLELHTHEAHTTTPKVICLCKTTITTRGTVKRHIRRHENSETYCIKCNTYFPQAKDLDSHMLTCWPQEDFIHGCQRCPKKFPSITLLKVHEKKHRPKKVTYGSYPCDLCDKRFKHRATVKSHVMMVHNNERPFICDTCGHTFKSAGALRDHLKIHSNESNFPCPKCSKRFKTKYRLNVHMDSHGDTSYQCPKCPAILNSKITLRNHQTVHDDFCKYVCGFCNKAYKRKKVLTCHMNRHTGNQPYICLWCPKTFVDNSHLRNHKKRMHPTELAEYEAVHGSPLDNVVKNDGSKGTKVLIKSVSNSRRNKIVVHPSSLTF